MENIKLDIEPFAVGEVNIAEVKVTGIKFLEFTEVWDNASAVNFGNPETALQKQRILAQTEFKTDDGEIFAMGLADLSGIPATVARTIIAHLSVGQGTAGKVIGNGDGAIKPIQYKLGTPLTMNASGKEPVVVEELEFHAVTYGELEDVLAADNNVDKTRFLLRTVAKPVTTAKLTTLPHAMLTQLTVADGVEIMNHVTPNF